MKERGFSTMEERRVAPWKAPRISAGFSPSGAHFVRTTSFSRTSWKIVETRPVCSGHSCPQLLPSRLGLSEVAEQNHVAGLATSGDEQLTAVA